MRLQNVLFSRAIHAQDFEGAERSALRRALLESWDTINETIELTLAARVDTHSRLEDPVFSPRAALTWEPASGQNLRVNMDTGATFTDTPLTVAGLRNIGVVEVAYTNNFSSACRTTYPWSCSAHWRATTRPRGVRQRSRA